MGPTDACLDDFLWDVPPRTKFIIQWLLARADRIEKASRLKLVFNCRGRSITPLVEEFWDAENPYIVLEN